MDWLLAVFLIWLLWRLANTDEPKKRRSKEERGFYLSPAWKGLRKRTLKENKQHYERRYPTCERCGSHAGQTWRKALVRVGLMHPGRMKWHVDHIKARSTHPHLALTYENTQVLCAYHNIAKSNLWGLNWKWLRRWSLDPLCPFLSVLVSVFR